MAISTPASLISIIIPLHNLGQYLEECLESIFKQDLVKEAYEIVIVDDASTDDSLEIAQALRLNNLGRYNIRILRHQENRYLANTLNTGIQYSKSKYVMCLDADNMLGNEHTLSTLLNALEGDRDIDIAYGAMDILEPSGKIWHTDTWPPKEYSHELQLSHKNQISSTALFRRIVWQRTCGYRNRERTAEDAMFWCIATSIGFVPKKVTDSTTLVYRNREDSMSHVEKDWPWEKWVPNRERYSPSTHQPLHVSVIIPCGPGHEGYLLDAIDSIWRQTLSTWECIVINDTGHELKRIPAFVRVIDNDTIEHSPAVARNIGIAVAKAETIMFLDADDTIEPDTLELMYKTWLANKGYVYCDWTRDSLVHECPEHDCSTVGQALWHPSSILLARSEAPYFDPEQVIEDWDYILDLNQREIYGTRVRYSLLNVRANTSTREFTQEDILRLKDKWGSIMPKTCASCGARRMPNLARIQQHMATQAALHPDEPPIDINDRIKVQYTGIGSFPMRGPITGLMYYFSAGSHSIKDVFAVDADKLLSHKDIQRV